MTGRVIKIAGLTFHVKLHDEIVLCSVRGSVKEKAEYELSPVVVGDDVKVIVEELPPSESELRSGVITEVLPRRTHFAKKKTTLKKEREQIIAANIDQMIIVASVKDPPFRMRLIDRFVITAHQGGMTPVVVINKIDLKHTVDIERAKEIYRSVDIQLIFTSAPSLHGIEELRAVLHDKESVFVGQSGAGKSSLLNAIQPGLKLRTGKISDKSGKGKHTTTVVELFPLEFGGFVVDTPGLRALGLAQLDKWSVDQFYSEIFEASHGCRFSDCRHKNEPDCAVKKAVKEGSIFPERYNSYMKIFDDID
ncbi:MAG: ribosome small subunit-dependent GTPase A [candidate division Zixibacteria bacterium]|nr:ribosome small subunit-dependent GTPase A [candidate division Zixibacteria bacterium]MBU1469051.1 ribosome small subunit-dependent GTPase A [candidate division Zixibacteria bacterium]MBU2624627.1 ribosome small subunit-dependent GTPase A [candidate division Zixibacteria bacterium]